MNSDTEELSLKDEDILESASDINFEDLIKVSNVSATTSPDAKDESKNEEKSTISTTASSSQSSTITTTSTTTVPTVVAKVVQKVTTTTPTVSTTGTTTTVGVAAATTAPTVTVVTAPASATATSSTTSTSTKAAAPGQVVIIQGPSGTSVPIRIATSANVNAQQGNNQNKKVTIQVLKMPDGSFVHLKNNKQLNLTNLSNVTHMNIGNKKSITTTGNQQSIVIKNIATPSSSSTSSTNVAGTTQTKVTTVSANLGTQILKSVSSVDNSKITVPKAKILENIQIQKAENSGSTSLADNANTGAVTTSTNTIKVMTTTSNTGGTTKQNDSATTKQIIVPHHVLKLSPSSSGTVQAIQIPGKTGFQYVRVLGANANTANSSTSAKILNPTTTVSSRDSGTTTTPTQLSTGQKLILNTKSRQNSTPIILNKDTVVVSQSSTTSTQKQQMKSLITIPSLRKITENGKTLTIIKKERTEGDDEREEKPKIIKIQNSTSQNTSSSGNKISNGQKLTSVGKIPHVFMVSKDFLKKNNNDKKEKTIEIIASIKTENSPQKKLYSVLKPTSLHDSSMSENVTDDTNSFSLLNRKRSLSPPDVPRRKHCNCTKSQCLKLYCDCFANSEFCQDCNCKECFNNLENENERQKAIKICLERNPNAFKPKITKARDQSDMRLHNKGCNCKRSGCLKNYCECYEAKIACSANCKCLGCRNVEDRSDGDQADVSATQHISTSTSRQSVATKRSYDEMRTATAIPSTSSETGNKQAYNFITEDVVDATVQCMFAQTEECKKSEINGKNSERMIIEELGRCLVEIIDFSIRNMDN